MTDATERTGAGADDGPAGGRAAVLLPGARYAADGPLLMFAGEAARRRGAEVYPVTWDLSSGNLDAAVVAGTEAALAGVTEAAVVLFGKSLGNLAAPVAAARGLPAVWFTPLLTEPRVVRSLREATVPFMLIGGTSDNWWDGAIARELTPHVVEVPGADHGMFVPGPLAASASVLGEVITAVERFLDTAAWAPR